MSRYLNSKYTGLKEYVPGEQPKDMKYVKLNTNESPFPPSEGVVDAIDAEAVKSAALDECFYCTAVHIGAGHTRNKIGKIGKFPFSSFREDLFNKLPSNIA